MDLLSEVNKVDIMSKDELITYAQDKAINLMHSLNTVATKSNNLEKYGFTNESFFVKLAFACIASNNKVSKEEYELFLSLTGDYVKGMDYKRFKQYIESIDLARLMNVIDSFTDNLTKTAMSSIKMDIVCFALAFIAIDGNMSDAELSFINLLVA